MALRDEYLEGLYDMGEGLILTNDLTNKRPLSFDYLEALNGICFGTSMFIKKGAKLFPKSAEYEALEAFVVETINDKTVKHGISLKSTECILDEIFGFYVDNVDESDDKSYVVAFCNTFLCSSPFHLSEIEPSVEDIIKMFNREIFSKLSGHISIKGESRWCQENPYLDHSRILEKIKDKKDHVEFASGAVRDIQEGKGRMDLVPLDVVCDLFSRCSADDFGTSSTFRELAHIERFKNSGDTSDLYLALIQFCRELYVSPVTMVIEVSKHFEDSLKKYKENNWKLGIPVNSFINSASRHYLKWLRGDTDERHDLAFVWNLMCCISTINSNDIQKTPAKEE